MSWRRITLLATLIVLGTVSATSTAAATTASYSGRVSATGVKWQYKTLSVPGSGPLTETLTWSTSTAKLLVGLSHKNANGTWTWVGGQRGVQPVTLTTQVTPGTWRLAVEALSAASSSTRGVTYPDAAPSTTVRVALTPASILADGKSTSTAMATVTGPSGGPVVGADVEFASSDAGQVIGPVTDNGDGTYNATITASTTSGAETITATDESATPTVSGHAMLTQTSTMPPEVTLIFSRTELSAADHTAGGEFGSCTRDDRSIAPLDTVVAPYVAANYPNVRLVGSIETSPTTATGHWCPHSGRSYGSSWADLTNLMNLGWSFIDHSATYATNWSSLTQQQQYDETCGSRDVITSHGLPGANGQFDWPNNRFDATVNTNFVRKCFSFSRGYGSGVTTAAQIDLNNGQQSTRGVSGGHCNVTGLPCTTVNKVKAYTLPSTVIAQMRSLQPGQWQNLQTYVLVTGKSPTYATNNTKWDCTSPDPRYHWTNDVERYCWTDMQTVLAALNADASVKSNSPAGVATDWGLAPPPQ